MPEQNLLDERFEALRQAPGVFAPPTDAATLRHRGHVRTVRRRVGGVVAGGALAIGAVLGGGALLGPDVASPTYVPPAAPSAPVVQEPAPTQEPTQEPTPDAVPTLPNDQPADGKDFGYVTDYFAKGGTIYLVLDRATLLTGEEARIAREEAGLLYEEGVDGLNVFVRNDNPTLREVPVDDFATVVASQQLLGDAAQGPKELELADLMLHLDATDEPLLVELAYDGVRVGTVTEHYLP